VKKLKEVSSDLYEQLEGDEKALVDAMISINEEYGKFGSEGSSVYISYKGPEENEDKEIGVKCGNCVFHYQVESGIACSAIDAEIEDGGICRLSMIPPGYVNAPEPMEEAVSIEEAETYKIPVGVSNAAKRALKWIAEGKAGSGFTSVGRRRAAQLAKGGTVSRDTVMRMKSYFARHNVDKKATGFNSGQEGYPSPGRVAWDAWGGTAGQAWVNGIRTEESSSKESMHKKKKKKKKKARPKATGY
jgi:hypothetical protein